MEQSKECAINKILNAAEKLGGEEKVIMRNALIDLTSIRDVTYVMLDKGYNFGYLFRQFLK